MPKQTVNDPAVRGAFGTIFYDKKGGRSETYGPILEPSLAEIEKQMYEQSVRDQIPPPHPKEWDTFVQQRSKLTLQSTESPTIVSSLVAHEFGKHNPVFHGALGAHGEHDDKEAKSGYAKYLNRRRVRDDDDDSDGGDKNSPPGYLDETRLFASGKYKPPELSALEKQGKALVEGKDVWGVGKGVTAMAAIHLNDRDVGGRFHVPMLKDPYSGQLQATRAPSDSAHITTTPKMWPIASQYPTSNSKSQVVASAVSDALLSHGSISTSGARIRTQQEPIHLYSRTTDATAAAADDVTLASSSSLGGGSWVSESKGRAGGERAMHSAQVLGTCSKAKAVGARGSYTAGLAASSSHQHETHHYDQDEASLTSSITGGGGRGSEVNSQQYHFHHNHNHNHAGSGYAISGVVSSSSGQGSGGTKTNASLLQQALVTCGRLQVEGARTHSQRDKVDNALAQERKTMRGHGRWLQNNSSRPSPKVTVDDLETAGVSAPTAPTGAAQSGARQHGHGLKGLKGSQSVSSGLSMSMSKSSAARGLEDKDGVDSLYSAPYQDSFAGLPYSQRVAQQQQARLERSTDVATRALGSYKEQLGKNKKGNGKESRMRPVDEKRFGEENHDDDDDDEDHDPYAKPAWRDKKKRRDHSGGKNGETQALDKARDDHEQPKGKGKGGKMPLHPSLGTPLSPTQLVDLHGDEGTIASSHYSRENHKRYGQQMAEHLDTVTSVSGSTGGLAGSASIPRNPFRPARRREMAVQNQAKPLNPLVPTDYKPSMEIRRPAPRGNVTIVIRPEKTLNFGVPTEDEVHDALARVSRRAILAYDTRIVETGTLAKALEAPALSTPGLAAVFDLHQAFLTAASLNPNPWQLKREQMVEVLMNKLFWLDPNVCRRLVSAYDPTATGLIRFVRLSVSLICCMKPGLAVLITTLERLSEEREAKAKVMRDRAAMRDRLMAGKGKAESIGAESTNSALDASNKRTVVTDAVGEGRGLDARTPLQRQREAELKREADREHAPELFLIKLIHSMYEDCEGGLPAAILDNTYHSSTRALASPDGMGLRLEDLVEALSCCAASIEDELSMAAALKPIVQHLYVVGQAKDDVIDHTVTGLGDGHLEEAGSTSASLEAVWMQSDDAHSIGSRSQRTFKTLSSSFTPHSSFTPKTAPHSSPNQGKTHNNDDGNFHSATATRAATGSGSGSGKGKTGATAQDRDREDQAAKRAAERWRLTRGLGRERVNLGRGGALSAVLSEHQSELQSPSRGYGRSSQGQGGLGGGLGGGGGSVGCGGGSLRWGADSLAWASDRDDHSLGSLSTLPSVSVAGGGGSGARSRQRLIGARGSHPHPHPHPHSHSHELSEQSNGHSGGRGRLHSTEILQHLSLRSSKNIPRVTQAELIAAFLQHPSALKEFVRQLSRFRSLCFPNSLHGSVTYTEAKLNPSVPYGKMNL